MSALNAPDADLRAVIATAEAEGRRLEAALAAPIGTTVRDVIVRRIEGLVATIAAARIELAEREDAERDALLADLESADHALDAAYDFAGPAARAQAHRNRDAARAAWVRTTGRPVPSPECYADATIRLYGDAA